MFFITVTVEMTNIAVIMVSPDPLEIVINFVVITVIA